MRHAEEFQPAVGSVAKVRGLVCRVADVDPSHPAVLIASELATNAVIHARTMFTVAVFADQMIRIEVTDQTPDQPTLEVQSPRTGGGFGLQVIDKLTRRWGTDVAGHRKTVWTDIPA